MRNILAKEKLKDKSPRGQVYVDAHHEQVQGHELRGQGTLGVEHRSHRDEEARELHHQVAQYKGEAQHEPRGAQHCRSLHENIWRDGERSRSREPRILDGTNGDD